MSEKDSASAATTGAPAGSPAGAASSNFLSSFLHKLKEKDREQRERDDRQLAASLGVGDSTPTSSPAPAGDFGSPVAVALPVAPHSSPSSSAGGSHDRAQAALVSAALSRRKDAAGSTKDKFLGLFKSDAEKRAEREAQAAEAKAREAAQEEAARTKAEQAAALEPIKLELTCAEPASVPMVGRAIRAAAVRPSAGSSAAAAALRLGVGSRGVCRWFRAAPDGGFDKISESVAPLYIPTLDDVDCRICCQWVEEVEPRASDSPAAAESITASRRTAPVQSSFGEIGPICMDPSLALESLALFAGGKATFVVREQESDTLVSIVVKRTMIRVLPAQGGGGGEVKVAFLLRKPSPGSQLSTSFTLDLVDPLRFSIEEPSTQKSFRGYILSEGEGLAQYANARRQRDAMACLIRRIIRTGSEALPASGTDAAAGSAVDAAAGVPVEAVAGAAPSMPLLSLDVRAAPEGSDDLVSVSVTAAPLPSCSVSVALPSLSVAISSPSPAPLFSPPPAAASPSVSPLPPFHSPASSTTSTTAASAAARQRISELTAEKNLFRENLNLVLEDKQRVEAESASKISSLIETLAARDSEVSSLNRRLAQSGEDVDSLKLAIQNLSGQMSSLANAEIKMSLEIRTLKAEREAAQADARLARENFQAKNNEVLQLKTQMEQQSKSHADQVAASANEVASLQSELRRLASADDRASRAIESEQNLRHDQALLQAELTKLREVQTKLDAVEMENHQLRKEREKKRTAATGSGSNIGANGAAVAHAEGDAPANASELVTADASSDSPSHKASPHATRQVASPSPSSSSSSTGAAVVNAGAVAALQRLTEQHALLQSQHAALQIQQATTLTELENARSRVEVLEAAASAAASEHAAALAALEAKLASATAAQEEAISSRNFFKRKCESLSSSMDKMLKADGGAANEVAAAAAASARGGGRPLTPSHSSSKLLSLSVISPLPPATPSSASPAVPLSDRERDLHASELLDLRSMVQHLRAEGAEMQKTLAAYKRTLESNYALLKVEREAHQAAASSSTAGVVGGLFSRGGSSSSSSKSSTEAQVQQLRSLANSLSELLAEKDLSLAHQTKSNLLLGARVHELERRFEKELEASGDTKAGRSYFGKIHLEEEEEEDKAT